ncbi:hypothetical protein ACFQ9X_30280 [Catenulispora yoronensis]
MTRPGAVRDREVALVLDRHPSMAAWQGLGAEVETLLDAVGGFRRVTAWYQSEDAEGRLLVGPRPDAPGDRPLSALRDPSGRRIIMVLTVALTDAWRWGTAQDELAALAVSSPVVLAQPLPARLWHRTGLQAVLGWLRAHPAGEPVPLRLAGAAGTSGASGRADTSRASGRAESGSASGKVDPAGTSGRTDLSSASGGTGPSSASGGTDPGSASGRTDSGSASGGTDSGSASGRTDSSSASGGTDPGSTSGPASASGPTGTSPAPGSAYTPGRAGPVPNPAPASAPAPLPIPVLELAPGWLDPFARLLAGGLLEARFPLLMRPVPVPREERRRVAGIQAEELGEDPAERVRRFRSSSSPEAYRLAAYLSVTTLALPVMRMVQRTASPPIGASALAEVLAGGLLTSEPAPAGAGNWEAREELRQFRYPGRIGEILRGGVQDTEVRDIHRRTGQFLLENYDVSGRLFRAALSMPSRESGGHSFALIPVASLLKLAPGFASVAGDPDEWGDFDLAVRELGAAPDPGAVDRALDALRAVLRRLREGDSRRGGVLRGMAEL